MSQESASEKPHCYIHNKANIDNVDIIRQNICVNKTDHSLTKYTDGKYYCLFHLPTNDKDIVNFEKIFRARLNSVKEKIAQIKKLTIIKQEKALNELSYNFKYVWFPTSLNLSDYKFEVTADFSNATFSADVSFIAAEFSSWAVFTNATFSAFGNFAFTNFSEFADFNYVEIQEAAHLYFYATRFFAVGGFYSSSIQGRLTFEGRKDEIVFLDTLDSSLDLQYMQIEKSERVTFRSVRLRPNWFVFVDSRKIGLIDIRWINLNSKFLSTNIRTELESVLNPLISGPNNALEVACWQLAANAEENNRYVEASEFRKMANEAKRLGEYDGFKIWSLNWWYWFSSFYGESWQRALAILFGIWLIFAVIYTQFDFNVCQQPQTCEVRKLSIISAMKQSFGSLFLQKSEFRKPMETAETFTLFENILAPLQAALLALAIRRRFMR